jgi:UDP-N-acetylmuramate--alanine ligase
MSGIAEVLVNLGYAVSGSDAKRSDVTDRLAAIGVTVAIGHDARHLGDADVVVVSSAIPTPNPEIEDARRRHVPVIPRAEMLAELMRVRTGIAIAGAHGKTTTTSMVAWTLDRAGLDPMAVIGGRLGAFGGHARIGQGAYMVAEADESDRSFLTLAPTIVVITNLDREHLDAYGTYERLEDAFVTFADRVPFYGAVVACRDDAGVAAILPRMRRRVITYGFDDGADVRGLHPGTDGRGASCDVAFAVRGVPGATGSGTIELKVPGVHNLLNALAAVSTGLEVGVPFATIAGALADFRGAERRFTILGSARGVTVVDDYGHHPTEIAAVLRAARAGTPRRLVAVFQPHRFTRTRDLIDDFGPALSLADVVVLSDIYAAGEAPIDGVTIERLADAVRRATPDVHVVKDVNELPDAVAGLATPGDLVVLLGAGSIGGVGKPLLARLEAGKVVA